MFSYDLCQESVIHKSYISLQMCLLYWQVGADDRAVLDQIIDSLTSLANPNEKSGFLNQETKKISLMVGKVQESGSKKGHEMKMKSAVLILGAGRVCQPAAELLASTGSFSSHQRYKAYLEDDFIEQNDVQVIVGSLYLKDAEEVSPTKNLVFVQNLASSNSSEYQFWFHSFRGKTSFSLMCFNVISTCMDTVLLQQSSCTCIYMFICV